MRSYVDSSWTFFSTVYTKLFRTIRREKNRNVYLFIQNCFANESCFFLSAHNEECPSETNVSVLVHRFV